MGISKLTYGSGDNLFEISYKDDEVITDSGSNSYMSNNFEANAFAAYQNKKQTQFFEAGADTSYNGASESNCMWQKWSSSNKTDLLSGADNPSGYYTLNCLLTDNGNGRRIVTELTDIQRVVWRPEVMDDVVNTRINGVATGVRTYRINTNTNQYYCDIMDADDPEEYTAQNVPIFPWLLYPQDKTQLQLHYSRRDQLSPWGTSCYRESGARNTGNNSARTYPLSTALIDYDVPVGNSQNFGFYDNSNNYLFYCTLSTNNYAEGNVYCYICTEHELKTWLASGGLKFIYKNKMYKPVAEGDIIVGYTDDMTSKSDWDDWHTKDDHDKPADPPAPPRPSPGQWDNIEGAGTFNGTLQFVRSYYMSSTELLNLKTWMGKKEADGGPPDGYDMLESIIAIKMFPFALASGADDAVDITIPGSGSAWSKLIETNWIARVAAAIDNTIVPEDAPVQYRHINTGCMGHATNASGINYDLGTLNMSDFVNDQYPFFTYDAAVELYIPFVGTFTLDPQTVMGRTLHCYLNLDPATGGVFGYCLCNNNGNNVMIASGTGNIAVDVPISSAQAGVLQARVDALRNQQYWGILTSAATMALPVIGAASAAGAAAFTEAQMLRGIVPAADISSAASAAYRSTFASELGSKNVAGEAVATTANALTANRQVKNLTQSHNMAMTGSVGASTAEWGCPWDAYVKVMRPKVHHPGNNYNHAVAVPAYTSGKLSSYKGLTVCVNPDASKIAKATPAERNAIVSMLQGGVIV